MFPAIGRGRYLTDAINFSETLMSKRSTVLYVVQSSSLPTKSKGALTIAAGKQLSVRVPVISSEGWVNELIVNQVPSGSGGGTSIDYTVELLDSCVPFHGGDSEDAEVVSNYNAAAAVTVEHFRVVDAVAATAGNTAKLRSADFGYPFQNADGTRTHNQAYLYLVIRPNNALDQTQWEASLTTTSDIG